MLGRALLRQLIRATIACIADKGVERTSIADIRRRAGMSSGALYVHFQNKNDLVAAALSYGSLTEDSLPESWAGFTDMVTALGDQLGFDMTTVARNRLHLHAESVLPGGLHDVYRPVIERSLSTLADRLRLQEARGEMSLRMSAEQTARAISALIDGLLWIALATDRNLDELGPDLRAGLACLVEEKPSS